MEIAYAAGLFDGEGYVRIARWEKPGSIHIRYNVIGGIAVTYLPIIQALRDQFGGSINQNRHDLRNPKHRIQFTWHIASQTAATFFRQIVPYLIIKREEVELALRLQDDIDAGQMTKFKGWHNGKSERNRNDPERLAIHAYREDLANQLFALKKRTFPPLSTDGTGRSLAISRPEDTL
jgi:hypothetical protein